MFASKITRETEIVPTRLTDDTLLLEAGCVTISRNDLELGRISFRGEGEMYEGANG